MAIFTLRAHLEDQTAEVKPKQRRCPINQFLLYRLNFLKICRYYALGNTRKHINLRSAA